MGSSPCAQHPDWCGGFCAPRERFRCWHPVSFWKGSLKKTESGGERKAPRKPVDIEDKCLCTPPAPRRGFFFLYLNLSCPAVSQICSFTVFPPTLTTLEPNSTPIVWFESCLTAETRGARCATGWLRKNNRASHHAWDLSSLGKSRRAPARLCRLDYPLAMGSSLQDDFASEDRASIREIKPAKCRGGGVPGISLPIKRA